MTAQTLTVAQCCSDSDHCQGRGSQDTVLTVERETAMTTDNDDETVKAEVPVGALTSVLTAARNDKVQTEAELMAGEFGDYDDDVEAWLDELEVAVGDVTDSLSDAVEQSDWTEEQIADFKEKYRL